MYDQISLDNIALSQFSDEKELFSYISDLIKSEYNDSESLTLKKNKQYYSVSFFNVPKIRIKKVRNELFLEITGHFIDELKVRNIEAKLMSDGYYRINRPCTVFDNNLRSLIFEIYEYCYRRYSDDRFDCCSRYLECSDNKKCVYEDDKKLFRACSYRYTMHKKGKIFYGKNRNV